MTDMPKSCGHGPRLPGSDAPVTYCITKFLAPSFCADNCNSIIAAQEISRLAEPPRKTIAQWGKNIGIPDLLTLAYKMCYFSGPYFLRYSLECAE